MTLIPSEHVAVQIVKSLTIDGAKSRLDELNQNAQSCYDSLLSKSWGNSGLSPIDMLSPAEREERHQLVTGLQILEGNEQKLAQIRLRARLQERRNKHIKKRMGAKQQNASSVSIEQFITQQ